MSEKGVESERGGTRRWERPARWILIGAMIAAAIWWICYTPRDAEEIWRAIPADVMYFSRHEQPAGRLPALAANPLTMTLLRSAGVSPLMLHEMSENPDVGRWILPLFDDEVVLAYVPELGFSREPAWVFSSWIGTRARRLRWTLALRGIPGIRAVEQPGRATFWQLDDDSMGNGQHLSLVLKDGYLLGCISSDATGVEVLMATWNRESGYPSLQNRPWRSDVESVAGSEVQDWGAYVLRPPAAAGKMPALLVPALHQLEVSRAEGRVEANFAAPAISHGLGLPPEALETLHSFLGDTPVFAAFASAEFLSLWVRQPQTPRWALVLAQALSKRPDHGGGRFPGQEHRFGDDAGQVDYAVFLGVLEERYAGTIRGADALTRWVPGGVTVPAIIAGVYVGGDGQSRRVLMDLLDGLNRTYSRGFIPRLAPDESVTVLEDTSSGDSFYQRLPLQEQVGVVEHAGWLLFSSRAGTLEKLLQEANRSHESPPVNRWLPRPDMAAAPAFGWTDLTAFTPLANQTLATISLMLLAADPFESMAVRQNLLDARAWLESLRIMEEARLWLDGDAPRLTVRFELGK